MCFFLKHQVFAACFSNYPGKRAPAWTSSEEAWTTERGWGAGLSVVGGVSVCCCGWSGVTYLETLPGPCALWEEERETAVLLVWTKWLRDHCQRELTERLPWLSAPLSGSTQNVFPRSRFSLCIRGSQPVASRPAGDLNKTNKQKKTHLFCTLKQVGWPGRLVSNTRELIGDCF